MDERTDELGGWTRDELARTANAAVADAGTAGFYAVAGSHIYGFPSDDSDVDLRGFHCADGVQYLLLDHPDEQVVADPVASGAENRADVDFVSYELRKFAKLLYEANFNVLEVVFDGLVASDDHPDALDALRTLVRESLPLDVPKTYMGMAKHLTEHSLRESGESTRPTAKTYLYALRGALATYYVEEERDIEANVRVLSDAVLGDTAVVDSLVDAKRTSEGRPLDATVAAEAERLLERLVDADRLDVSVDKSEYRMALDAWMLDVRGVER